MNTRYTEVLTIVMQIFTDLRSAPEQFHPFRTIQLRAGSDYSLHNGTEIAQVINTAIADGLFMFKEGGPAGMGYVALTDKGYQSRNMN